MDIRDLKIEEKIAQMLIIAIQEEKITEKTLNMIRKHKIGGVILYRRNYNSYEEMVELINKLKEANKENKIPLFISIDQEGGRVNRMPEELLNIKSANDISKLDDINLIKQNTAVLSKMLRETGINLNYSPVMDIKRFKGIHPIGDRCYGDNKEDVIKYAIEVMKQEMQDGIIPVIKHFPGHGATEKDSHFSVPIIKKQKEKLENEDMLPFQKAIENGAECIMMGHLIVKDIDKNTPASLSKKIINKYLKQKYNYNGIIITDDLKMLAIRLKYRISKAVQMALNAGNDILMIGLSYKTIEKIIKKVSKKVKKGKISEERINQSVEKIIKLKEKYNITDEQVLGINIEEVNKEIEKLNKY